MRDSGEASQVDGFCAIAGVQLLEDILDMFVDGRLGNGEFLGDFAVLAPFAHEVQDFVFAASQRTPLSGGIQRLRGGSLRNLIAKRWYFCCG